MTNFNARQKQYGTHRNRVIYVGTKTVIFTPRGRGYCLYNVLQGEASSERDTFFRLQLYENVGILLVEEYKRKIQISGNFLRHLADFEIFRKSHDITKRAGRSVILVCKWEKCSVLNWVCQRGTIYQLNVYGRGTFSVKNGILKGKGLELGAEPLKTPPGPVPAMYRFQTNN